MIYGTIHQLKSKGFNVSQIATQLNVSRNRVYDYLSMDRTTFDQWDSKRQRKVRKLDDYGQEFLPLMTFCVPSNAAFCTNQCHVSTTL